MATVTFAGPTPANVPLPCLDRQWLGKHRYLSRLVLQASRKPPLDIYFLGDSITEFWPEIAKDLWKSEFGKLRVLNCGVSGDTTQNILFRITNGEFDRISPKVVVLLAGINNLGLYPNLTPDDLAVGLQGIIKVIRTKSPATKILVLSIFPAAEAKSPLRARITETNKRIARLADNEAVFYLDIYNVFLDKDGNFPATISPDGTHLNALGYKLWADAMRPTLQKLLAPPGQ